MALQNKPINLEHLKTTAQSIRLDIIEMLTRAASSHLGCCFSIADIITVLYHHVLDPEKIKTGSPERDYFILSKGHAAGALYSGLASSGIISKEILDTYGQDGSLLCGHPMKSVLPGIEASTGSLGHGLSIGVGLAFAAKYDNKKNRVFVLVGDGECQEGSIWEAITVAAHFKLNNLTLIVDNNNLQSIADTPEQLMPGGFEAKFKAFCWNTKTINGHDLNEIATTLSAEPESESPTAIVAKTTKGHGVSFIENKVEWHYRSFKPDQYEAAKKEVQES